MLHTISPTPDKKVRHIAFAGIVVEFDAPLGLPEHLLAGLAREQCLRELGERTIEEYEVGVTEIQLHPDEEEGMQ